MDVTYGYPLEENDSLLEAAKDSFAGFSETIVPGKFLVDFFPPLRFIPSWFPGARFQRLADHWSVAKIRLT